LDFKKPCEDSRRIIIRCFQPLDYHPAGAISAKMRIAGGRVGEQIQAGDGIATVVTIITRQLRGQGGCA
jgi:hypothetical protein